jgi:hypothetical protein
MTSHEKNQKVAILLAMSALTHNYGYMLEPEEVSSKINEDNMFVVWYCKTLQNWKALVGCMDINEYVEVTYNGNNGETYVDIYNKALNVVYTKDTTEEIAKYAV